MAGFTGTTLALIQARLQSTRLPGKVLETLGDRTVLGWAVRAAQAIPGVDRVAIATSTEPADDAIVAWAKDAGVTVYRGPEQDVLQRFADAATADGADLIFRLTADCPLLDPSVAGMVLRLLKSTGADYASNVDPATWPDGLDCEVFTRAALIAAHREAARPSEREHVTPFIRANRARFKVETLINPIPGQTGERWTVDTPEDLAFLRGIVADLGSTGPASYTAVLDLLERKPELREVGKRQQRNEGYTASIALEPVMSYGYTRSNALLKTALEVVPVASQTFSKSYLQLPSGAAPLFLTHGDGGRVWDVDGNEYVDLVSSLMPVVLGYRDPDVDYAIRGQLTRGISFSLPTSLEQELSRVLCDLIPSAEMVRFGKNGSDVTAAAIRMARAFTGRDRIIACGYHGWQDWYIGATARKKGVPPAVQGLTSMVPYNDIEAFERAFAAHPGDVACVIMETMNVVEPKAGYLQAVKDLAHKHGALLIFDEIITGFRFALGGAQSLFGVTPDLSCFGKAMANGMPLSAVVGRRDVMMEMEQIFFSGTFGGEALSLAASLATIDKLKREAVVPRLWSIGEELATDTAALIAKHGLNDVFSLAGAAPWKVLMINDHPNARKEAVKTMFLTEMLARGILIAASHNLCWSHTPTDLAQIRKAWDESLAAVKRELTQGTLIDHLKSPIIEPIFKVR